MTAKELNEFEDNLPKHLTPLQEIEASMEYNRTGNKSGWWDKIPVIQPQPEATTTLPTQTTVTFVRRHTKNVAGTPSSLYMPRRK